MADAHTGRAVSAEFERSAGVFAIGKEERAAQALPPVHLLVVDDDEHVRGVCRSIAEEAGMKVFDVGTAEEALEVLGASRRAGQSRTSGLYQLIVYRYGEKDRHIDSVIAS